MRYLILFLGLLMHFIVLNAQQKINTSIKANDVISLFENQTELTWDLPISATEKLPILWGKRENSYQNTTSIESYVGYWNQEFVATLSIYKGKISIEMFFYDELQRSYRTNENGFLTLTISHNETNCGVEEYQNNNTHLPKNSTKRAKIDERTIKNQASTKKAPLIENTDILRIYRLAIPIDKGYFSKKFDSDIDKVKLKWVEIETYLNELYNRELGIRFKVLDREDLINIQLVNRKENNKDLESFEIPIEEILNKAALSLNQKIGSDSYELGVYIVESKNKNIAGLAYTGGIYKSEQQKVAVFINNLETIAHEIGHLFGAHHTASSGAANSLRTEVGRGQSLMSYRRAGKRGFFSLLNVQEIRSRLVRHSYFKDESRTQSVLLGNNLNKPVGILSQNQAPAVYEAPKSNYTMPINTAFEFYINAKDDQASSLIYTAHQNDITSEPNPTKARFYTKKSTTNPYIKFVSEYNNLRLIPESDILNKDITGTYNFLISVNDGLNAKTYATKYAAFNSEVTFVENSTPFKITSNIKSSYQGGEEVTLTWDVDKNVFGTDSKVEILLSDDFGETYPYTIVASTENDGEHTFRMPNVEVGNNKFKNIYNTPNGSGVFKIKVKDHIAYANTIKDIENKDIEKRNYRGTYINLQSGFTVTPIEVRGVGVGIGTESIPASALLTFGYENKTLALPKVEEPDTNSVAGTIIFHPTGGIKFLTKAGWKSIANTNLNKIQASKNVKELETGVIISDRPIDEVKQVPGILVLDSYHKALVLPKVEDVSTIPNPEMGSICYDLKTNQIAIYSGAKWQFL